MKRFNPDFTNTAMARTGFGEGVIAAAQQDPKVVVLSADLTKSISLDGFAKAYPERFFELGVAEQNMMGVAAGLALTGFHSFVASYATFNPGRNWDQFRVSVCYSNVPVTVIGAHAGISVGPDGATHQALEDIAMTRVLPNLVVIAPIDANQARAAAIALSKLNGPSYVRFGREATPILTEVDQEFVIGEAVPLQKGKDVTLLSTGTLTAEAAKAVVALEKDGISVYFLAPPKVKPLDSKAIIASVRKTGCVVTVEEAQIHGGLGGAVAECLALHHPAPQEFVGVQDTFAESGSAAELIAEYSLDAKAIRSAVKRALKRKEKIS